MNEETRTRIQGLTEFYPEGNRIRTLLDTVLAEDGEYSEATVAEMDAVIAEHDGSTVAQVLSQAKRPPVT